MMTKKRKKQTQGMKKKKRKKGKKEMRGKKKGKTSLSPIAPPLAFHDPHPHHRHRHHRHLHCHSYHRPWFPLNGLLNPVTGCYYGY
jgi:hypothetical protein